MVETEKNISDRELLNIFQKVQNLEAPQHAVDKDVVSTNLPKTDLLKTRSIHIKSPVRGIVVFILN